MGLEDIKTENDARQNLIELILEASGYHGFEEHLARIEETKEKYFELRNYARKNFEIDTTPYDNVFSEQANTLI